MKDQSGEDGQQVPDGSGQQSQESDAPKKVRGIHLKGPESNAVPETPSGSSKKKMRNANRGHLFHFFGIGALEPKNLDFMEMCLGRYPGKKWTDITLTEQAELIRDALTPQQYLIDPHCHYLKYWDMGILGALLYTSLVTPYEVGFLETEFNGLFVFNRCIDCIFLKDMIMQFFLKVQVQEQRGSIWIRNRKDISRRYMRGWFAIDLFSILPFDVLGLVLQDPGVQKLKVVRIIRLLRLLKLMRVLRASRIAKRWQNRISASFSTQGLCKFAVMLTMVAHWMACVWGMMGFLIGSNLECVSSDPQDYQMLDTEDGVSWITVYDWGPDSPCAHFDVYLAALHFSVMTITSIGYGDITPTRKEEYILCILCQLLGGLTWAYVIGSICGIIANANPMRVAFEQAMDALNAMLHEQHVDYGLRWQLREYLREQRYHQFLLRARDISNQFSPELKGNLILETAIGNAIKKVWYFHDCETPFVVEVAKSLEAALYSPREEIGSDVPDVLSLHVVERGSVARAGRIMLPGNFWGEDMILTSKFLADDTPGIALNFVEVLSLRKPVLEGIMVDFPKVASKIRKAALWIAFRNAVRICAHESLLSQNKLGGLAKMSRSQHGEKKRQAVAEHMKGIFDEMPNEEEEVSDNNNACNDSSTTLQLQTGPSFGRSSSMLVSSDVEAKMQRRGSALVLLNSQELSTLNKSPKNSANPRTGSKESSSSNSKAAPDQNKDPLLSNSKSALHHTAFGAASASLVQSLTKRLTQYELEQTTFRNEVLAELRALRTLTGAHGMNGGLKQIPGHGSLATIDPTPRGQKCGTSCCVMSPAEKLDTAFMPIASSASSGH